MAVNLSRHQVYEQLRANHLPDVDGQCSALHPLRLRRTLTGLCEHVGHRPSSPFSSQLSKNATIQSLQLRTGKTCQRHSPVFMHKTHHLCIQPGMIIAVSITSKQIGHSVLSSCPRFCNAPSAKTLTLELGPAPCVKFLINSSTFIVSPPKEDSSRPSERTRLG